MALTERQSRRLEILGAWVLGIGTTIAGNALATYYRAQSIPSNTAEIKHLSQQIAQMNGDLREIRQWMRDIEYYNHRYQGQRGGE